VELKELSGGRGRKNNFLSVAGCRFGRKWHESELRRGRQGYLFTNVVRLLQTLDRDAEKKGKIRGSVRELLGGDGPAEILAGEGWLTGN